MGKETNESANLDSKAEKNPTPNDDNRDNEANHANITKESPDEGIDSNALKSNVAAQQIQHSLDAFKPFTSSYGKIVPSLSTFGSVFTYNTPTNSVISDLGAQISGIAQPPAIQAAINSFAKINDLGAYGIASNAVTSSIPIMGISNVLQNIGSAFITPQIYTPSINSNLLSSINAFNTLAQELELIGNWMQPMHEVLDSPVMRWLDSFQFPSIPPIIQQFENLYNRPIDFDALKKRFLCEMKESRWFPSVLIQADYSLTRCVIHTIHEKRGRKSRTKEYDKVIFAYYTKSKIEIMRKSWSKLDIPKFKIRIMNQSVRAYYRGEYALTVSALVTLWEDEIQQKTHETSGYRTSGKTCDDLSNLIKQNDCDDVYWDFCKSFVFYKCTNINEVEPDVPGRHAIAHSWYTKYPSRKMALNAILFTDFLLNLLPLDNVKKAEFA